MLFSSYFSSILLSFMSSREVLHLWFRIYRNMQVKKQFKAVHNPPADHNSANDSNINNKRLRIQRLYQSSSSLRWIKNNLSHFSNSSITHIHGSRSIFHIYLCQNIQRKITSDFWHLTHDIYYLISLQKPIIFYIKF